MARYLRMVVLDYDVVFACEPLCIVLDTPQLLGFHEMTPEIFPMCMLLYGNGSLPVSVIVFLDRQRAGYMQ